MADTSNLEGTANLEGTSPSLGASDRERLRRLEAAEAARNLVAAYASAIDATDVDALERIFAPEMALLTRHRHYDRRDDVLAFYRTAFETGGPRRHFITNTSVDVDGPAPVARSYFFYVTTEDETPLIGWGRYEDTFGWRDGRLVFTAKSIDLQLTVDARLGWAAELTVAEAS